MKNIIKNNKKLIISKNILKTKLNFMKKITTQPITKQYQLTIKYKIGIKIWPKMK